LPREKTSSFSDANGGDLRACASFNFQFLTNLFKLPLNVGLQGEMFASSKRSLNPFPVTNLWLKVELMHLLRMRRHCRHKSRRKRCRRTRSGNYHVYIGKRVCWIQLWR